MLIIQIIQLIQITIPSMFICCCPPKLQQQSIKQSFLQDQSQFQSSSITKLQLNQNYLPPITQSNTKQCQQLQKQQPPSPPPSPPKPILSNPPPIELYHQQQLKGTVPYFHSIEQTPIFPKLQQRDQRKSVPFTKKSHLFRQPLKSDLIYFNLKANDSVYISYRIIKNQQLKQHLNILDYYLSKSQDKIHVLICKQALIYSCLLTLHKYNHSLIIINYGRIIDLEENANNIELIVTKNLRNIKWQRIDNLVVLTDGLYNHQNLKAYFDNFIKDLKWQQLKKTTFIFPGFMTLENISELLFSCMKQYVSNITLEKASLDLAFDMELIECANLDSFIIIKTRTQQNKYISSVYDHLKTSITMFNKSLNDQNQKIYRDFYIRIKQKPLQDYFTMKQLYRRNPLQFKTKVIQMRDFDPNTLTSLQNSPEIKQHPCQNSGFYYVIQNKVREDIGRIFNIPDLQKKQIDTPVKKQWDDNATAQDFTTVRSKKLDFLSMQQLNEIDIKMGWMDEDEDQYYPRNPNQQHEEYLNKPTPKPQIKINIHQLSPQQPQQKSNCQFSRTRTTPKSSQQDYFS